MKQCVYCRRDENVKMSREHVISSAVLRCAFGDENRNITRYYGKKFFNHEHVIKDVCRDCNSILSPYDVAGKEFIDLITPHYKSSYVKFPCDLNFINWLIKTHLNLLRIIKDVENSKYYNITNEIYKGILKFEYPSKSLLKLYVSGWLGKKYYWDENSSRRTQYFLVIGVLDSENKT